MKSIHLLLPSAAAILLSCFTAEAYTITGRIIDSRNDAPLRKAEIIARNDSSKFLNGLNSDQNGIFITADLDAPQILLEVSKEGYETKYIRVSGETSGQLDLGTIALSPRAVELNEVEVTAQSVIQKPDRYIVLPSKQEIERSSSSISLLNGLQMKMPGLKVIEELQSVTVDNRAPIFKINGKPADINKVLSINNDNILRIEYFDTPDIRYNKSVINFIMKPRQEGGSFVADIQSAVNAGFLNGSIGGTYYYKKSEWNINYGINRRDYNKWTLESVEQFIGRQSPVIRRVDGQPSTFGYTDNYLSLGYTYMHDPNTMFAASISGSTNRMHYNDVSINSQIFGSEKSSYDSQLRRNTDIKSPSIDLFFRKELSKGQVIEANAFGSYNTGDLNREYSSTYNDASKDFDITSTTDNKAWRAGGEIMYAKQFKHFTTKVGAKDFYNHTKNCNVENQVQSTSSLDQNNLYFYGQIVGRIKSLGYSIGVGGEHNHTSNGIDKLNSLRAKTNINLNYQLSKKISLNYLFMYSPTSPSLSSQSDVIQRIDDISLQQGNINLKPSVWFRNRIYLRYTERKFTSTFWASHSRTVDPIYYDCKYIGDADSPYYNMFLSRPINGTHDDRINLQLDLGVQNLFNHVSVFGILGWDGYTMNIDNDRYTDRRLYASINAAIYFGNWTLSANYDIKPQYSLSGNTLARQERFDGIRVQYKWKDWYFRVSGINMFTKRGSLYHQMKLSKANPSESTRYIKDNANMIVLNVTYRVNFGKTFRKASRSLRNGGVDSGANISY